ncbi:hypothetical protein CDD83_2920 [Cordyceps sp. RAO-2017]|nr:hypothetical protein CDD83_2920 [Cordyceps sp. RAO-2017]
MPPRRGGASLAGSPRDRELRSSAKRPHDDNDGAAPPEPATPSKRRRSSVSDQARSAERRPEPTAVGEAQAPASGRPDRSDELHNEPVVEAAPVQPESPKTTPRKRGRPAKAASQAQTPQSRARRPRPTPATPDKATDTALATPRRQAADRSARRKSARVLIENAVGGGKDDDDDEDDVVRKIYEDSEDDDDDDNASEGPPEKGQVADAAAGPPAARALLRPQQAGPAQDVGPDAGVGGAPDAR